VSLPAGSKPVPVPTDSTRPYWDGAARGELWLQRSKSTGEYVFYPRSSPPNGLIGELEWVRVSGRATLHSYVISHRPASGFTPPYVIAIVKLEEGTRMISNIVGVDASPENLPLDAPLQVAFEQRGEVAVPVFRLAHGQAAG
jgi:hypothetical protein